MSMGLSECLFIYVPNTYGGVYGCVSVQCRHLDASLSFIGICIHVYTSAYAFLSINVCVCVCMSVSHVCTYMACQNENGFVNLCLPFLGGMVGTCAPVHEIRLYVHGMFVETSGYMSAFL